MLSLSAACCNVVMIHKIGYMSARARNILRGNWWLITTLMKIVGDSPIVKGKFN